MDGMRYLFIRFFLPLLLMPASLLVLVNTKGQWRWLAPVFVVIMTCVLLINLSKIRRQGELRKKLNETLDYIFIGMSAYVIFLLALSYNFSPIQYFLKVTTGTALFSLFLTGTVYLLFVRIEVS